MNVQEELLKEKVDPFLTKERLSRVLTRALSDSPGVSAQDSPTEGQRRRRRGGEATDGYRILSGGCWNRVIAVRANGTDVVLKISPHEADERIIREYRVLQTFAEETDMPVPRPLLLDAEEGELPGTALAMTRLPGKVMHECFGLLNPEERRGIIDQIARDVTALHHRRGRGFGGVELAESDRETEWADFWLPRFDAVVAEAAQSGLVPEVLTDAARELRPHLGQFLKVGPESTMTHYDIWAGNVMVDTVSDPPRVSGYIDIPGFYADYARELSFAMLFGLVDRRFLEIYADEHALDEGFWLRANIYNLKMNIRHVQMYPSQRFYQEGAMENLREIHRAV